jgi:hypothetical protein
MLQPASEHERTRLNDTGIPAASSPIHSGLPRRWAVVLVIFCAAALLLLFRHIDRTLPYPHHIDEGFISGPASNILVKGELHPQRFNYPSLPTYLAAASMAVGFVRGATNLEIRNVDQIGRVSHPRYEMPRVVGTARQAFAFLSIVCLAMTGVSAWVAFQRPSTTLLAPVLLLASPLYFQQSWTYLNVDIVGASFVMLTMATVLIGTRRPSILQSAIVPGALAGLAAASKYTLVVAALPVLLAIGLHVPRGRRMWACVVAMAATMFAFLAAVPYSLIDIPGFLNGVGYEVFHYASGHAGNAGDPGLPQLLFYLRHFLTEFGPGAAVLAVLGLFLFPGVDWRRAAVVSIFPMALLFMLSSNRVHFTRNAVAIQPFVAMFAAFGLVAVHDWIVALATRRGWAPKRISVPIVAAVILTIAAIPFWHLPGHVRDRMDSRTRARDWVMRELPPNWALVVPTELGLEGRGLDARGRHVKVVSLRGARDPESLDALLTDVPAPAVIMAPRWGADRRVPGQHAADALNSLAKGWRVLQTFGTNDVLVNYTSPTPWGDPAFAIAILK